MTTEKTKNKFSELPDIVHLIVSVILAWTGCFFFTMRLGIVTTLPIILLTTFAAALLELDAVKTTALYAVLGLVLPLIDSRGLKQCVVLCILCALLCVFSYAGVMLLKKKSGNILISRIAAGAFIFAAFAVHLYFNSDTFTFNKNAKMIEDHIESEYKYEKLNRSTVYFDAFERSFVTEVAYSKRPSEKVKIYVSNGELTDEYVGLVETLMMENGKNELIDTLSDYFHPDDEQDKKDDPYDFNLLKKERFTVVAESILNFPRGQRVSAESEFDYSEYCTFSIYLDTTLTAHQFIEKAEMYYDIIQNSGFKCRELIFYAGSKGKYYAKIETRFLPMKARFDDKITKA